MKLKQIGTEIEDRNISFTQLAKIDNDVSVLRFYEFIFFLSQGMLKSNSLIDFRE